MLIDVDTIPTGVRATRRISRFWAPRPESLSLLREALTSDVVLLRGPAGVGKTSLLRQFAASLDDDTERGVQFIDGSVTPPDSAPQLLAAFADGPRTHVLVVDNHVEGVGLSTEHLLELLRCDPDLRIVVATRQTTGLESPLVTLEFDVHVLPTDHLLLTRDELAAVLALNGVVTTDVGIDALAERTYGWAALIQLAAARLRLEGLPLRTRAEAMAVADYANAAFTADLEQRLKMPVSDDVRLLAVAPHVTVAIADAMGVNTVEGSTGELVAHLQATGFMWPSSTRLTLAEPVREQWLREVTARRPDDVGRARLRLLEHLVTGGEPLLAAQLAADAEQWAVLADVLRSSGPEIWARDAEVFDRLVAILRTRAPKTPAVVDALLSLDPEMAASLDTPALVMAALAQLPDAKIAAASNIDTFALRVSLLRAAGRFALATETAALLDEAVRRSRDLSPEVMCEAWYQVGMTAFAMGTLREARLMLSQAERIAPPARRMSARGAIAVIDLLEGDVRGAQQVVAPDRDDNWRGSPWGEGIRLAEAWLRLESGDAPGARAMLDRLPATAGARELWPFAAAVHALSFLLSGSASDALGLLRTWMSRARSTPPSHFQSTQMLTARAKVLIALRQARKALSFFEGPFALAPATAPAIALAQLYAGRPHEAFVMSVKWGAHQEPSPRAALESLVVGIIADVRLNGGAAHRTAAQRAEALSARHDLWSPWSAISPEDRALVLPMLSPAARDEITRRCSFFASSVSVPHLTKREQVVLAHLTPTSTIADIAKALVVSPNTVKTQLQSLYRKLEVSDRASAIRAAHAWGLIEAETDL
ncbi:MULTISPECIES: LuxR C-terminal-related transcriptional regulator [Microbacterium]|uniref:LuxR C-terminal-related transcriptional regulator n=1 Tax=Microbacterium TaxID=33882 RepID=UPI00277E12E7|nr:MULTISPECIES: LuxR C-terminal-related transcriptional regulator [Microbacterium]MDQ1082998.1 LuxR family maltose regulon positive regulatory protein [Microbacterium sp. SORGH_AS_0344]MDQ1168235.1 LuxR family maltose regulon positive regulatory protein [Microbacterium proteolyticum]